MRRWKLILRFRYRSRLTKKRCVKREYSVMEDDIAEK